MFDPQSPAAVFRPQRGCTVLSGGWLSVTFRPVSYPDHSRRPRSVRQMLLLGRLVLDGGPADVSRQDVGSEASTRDACQRSRGWRGRTSMLQLAERRQRRGKRVMEGEADLIHGSKFCGPKFQEPKIAAIIKNKRWERSFKVVFFGGLC